MLVWTITMASSLFLYLNDSLDTTVSEIVGVLTKKSGQVSFRSPSFQVWSESDLFQAFEAGTLLRTGANSSAEVQLSQTQFIEMGANSQVLIGLELADAESSFLVSVIQGNMKATEQRQGKSLAAASLKRPFSRKLKIETKEGVAVLNSEDNAILSVEKRFNQPVSIETLQGRATLRNRKTGEILEFLPKKKISPPEKVDFIDSANWAVETEKLVNEIAPQTEAAREFLSFEDNPAKIRVPIRFQFQKEPSGLFESADPVQFRVALADAKKSTSFFKLQRGKRGTELVHNHALTDREQSEYLRKGYSRVTVGVEVATKDSPAGPQPSVQPQSLVVHHKSFATGKPFSFLANSPRVLKNASLPKLVPLHSFSGENKFTQWSTQANPTVHALIAGSQRVQLSKGHVESDSPTAIHFFKQGKILLSFDAAKPLQPQKLFDEIASSAHTDLYFQGRYTDIITTQKPLESFWSKALAAGNIHAMCGSKDVKIKNSVLRQFSDTRELLRRNCAYLYSASQKPRWIVARGGI